MLFNHPSVITAQIEDDNLFRLRFLVLIGSSLAIAGRALGDEKSAKAADA